MAPLYILTYADMKYKLLSIKTSRSYGNEFPNIYSDSEFIDCNELFPELGIIHPKSIYTQSMYNYTRLHLILDTNNNIHMLYTFHEIIFNQSIAKSNLNNQNIIHCNEHQYKIKIILGEYNIDKQEYYVETMNFLMDSEDNANICNTSFVIHKNIINSIIIEDEVVLYKLNGEMITIGDETKYYKNDFNIHHKFPCILMDDDYKMIQNDGKTFHLIYDNILYVNEKNELYYYTDYDDNEFHNKVIDITEPIQHMFLFANSMLIIIYGSKIMCIEPDTRGCNIDINIIDCNNLYFIQNKKQNIVWNKLLHKTMTDNNKKIIETIMICNKKIGIYKIPYYLLSNIITDMLFY